MWPAVSGAVAKSEMLDMVANNLANVDTAGFKKDDPTFKEYLSSVERVKQPLDIPRGPFQDKDFYPLDGKDQSFVVRDATYTNFRQGSMRTTKNPLDVAIEGPGFFEVSTPEGIRYTRLGSFKVTNDGLLVTPQGYPVLTAQPGGLGSAQPANIAQPGQGGLPTQGGVEAELNPNIEGRTISLLGLRGPISFTTRGEVFVGEDQVGQLAITEFKDSRVLRKDKDLLFQNPQPDNVKPQPQYTIVRQGMLEQSNVNPVEEMVRMIKAQRLFEHDLKAIKTYDALMGKEVNEVGKLR